MPGKRKLTPEEYFEIHIDDAYKLLELAGGLTNSRKYRMRRELRERFGDALSITQQRWDEIDCVESPDLFVVFKPGSKIGREELDDLRPLLRQSLVVGCAALETFVFDKTMERIGEALRSDEVPRRLREIPITLGDWIDHRRSYARVGWGQRKVTKDAVRATASTSPSQIGKVLSMIGISDWSRLVDSGRNCPTGRTVLQLNDLTKRRNRIVHRGDRVGRGYAQLSADEVRTNLVTIRIIVGEIGKIVDAHDL
jgi:hypothetical protein